MCAVVRPAKKWELLPGAPDRRPEELGWAHLCAALLALHCERRRDRSAAGRTTVTQLSSTGWADAREIGLALEEVALGVAAAKAEGHPVAERLPPLLLNPVALRLGHRIATVVPLGAWQREHRGREADAFRNSARPESALADCGLAQWLE